MKPFRKITGPATRQAIRRTLRAALNSAIALQLITFNPASHVELESGKRPKPLLWTNERVRRWRETGEIPGPVMVWTPQQFGAFLDAAEGDRLYAVFHLMGSRGLRRGEAVGQDWHEIDLGSGLITPAKEIVVDGWDPYESEPKTDGCANTIALDSTNRHSTITLTSDTYTSLPPELDREIAEMAAKLIPRSRQAAAEPSAQTAADPQATATSAHASLTQWLANEAASEPTEADPDAA